MSWKDNKSYIDVEGHKMAFVDLDGDHDDASPTIVFLHGNPTSSFLWRNIMPALTGFGRCVAPDLIGMGDSDKLTRSGAHSYRFVDHMRFLDAFLDQIVPSGPIILVIHDWGSALGFHWAKRHQDRVLGIAYMEGMVMPVSWSDWPDEARGIFQAMRSEAGEEIILEKNLFIEGILPNAIIRDLTVEEQAEYRRPFLTAGEDRRPTLTWPREIPIEAVPEDVNAIVEDYSQWLKKTEIPKLFINADPGSILIGRQREFCRSWPNQKEVTVKGRHFIQEDSPTEIAEAIERWIPTLGGIEQ